MHQWFYFRTGVVSDEQVGPIEEAEFLKVAFDGALKLKTVVGSPTRTKGAWIEAQQIPALKGHIEKGMAQREAEKKMRQEEDAAKRDAERQQRQLNSAVRRETAQSQRDEKLNAMRAISEPTADVKQIEKIYDKAAAVLTTGEAVEFIAIQYAVMTPDAIVITNKRLIVFRPKIFGRLDFKDYLWRDVGDAHFSQGILSSQFTAKHFATGETLSLDLIPKETAQRLYRIVQEREEQAIETRRQRHMEELRAGATNISVQANSAPAANSNLVSDDPIQRLQKLKAMFDQQLITPEEFAQRKQEILSQI